MSQRGNELQRVELAAGDTLFLRNELLLLCIRRPARLLGSITELAILPHQFGQPDEFDIVGESYAIWEVRERLASVGSQPFHTLILGASGTGKELVARALHARSARRARPLVSRNAATIPEGIADAELFGNVRGYPNVGMPDRPGLVGAAHESTLFLDEIAELPLALQVRLLRVLDSGEYHRLGEASARRVDLRVIGATNRPVTELREDVLARFTLRLTLPDLNARREDIPLLIAHLLRRHGARDPTILTRFFPDGAVAAAPRIAPRLVEFLVAHQYTTNVRELDAILMTAVLKSKGSYLEHHVPTSRQASTPPPRLSEHAAWLTPDEAARLALLRRHRFSPTGCGRDPAYPGNRQTADLHFRHIACKALTSCELDIRRAATLLAGDGDPTLIDKCQARLETFVSNLDDRIMREAPEQLERALTEDWKALADAVHLLVTGLRARRAGLTSPAPLRSA